jgi:hypothetical protein
VQKGVSIQGFAVQDADKAAVELKTAVSQGQGRTAANAFRTLEKDIESLTSALRELEELLALRLQVRAGWPK